MELPASAADSKIIFPTKPYITPKITAAGCKANEEFYIFFSQKIFSHFWPDFLLSPLRKKSL